MLALALLTACAPAAQPTSTQAPPEPAVPTATASPGAKPAGSPAASPAAQGDLAARQREALQQAYAAEAQKFGLPAIVPQPKVPFDRITLVDTSRYRKNPPFKIAHASQGPTNSWARLYDAAFEYQLRTKHKDVLGELFYADANGNADKQINDIEDLLARRPDVLVVTPLGAAVRGPVERAAGQGVPVVFCADAAPTERFISLVNRDNYLNGALFAEWLAKRLNYQGKILMYSGIAGSDTAEVRLRAARDVFKKYPEIQELGHAYADWTPVKGKQVTEAFLAAHSQVDGIWSDSALMMVGAIEAFAEAKRPIPPMTTEPLNGFLRLAREHNVEFLAVGFPPGQAAQCADTAVTVLQGEAVPNYVNVGAISFTQSEIDRWYKPDFSDDLWVDIVEVLPESELERLGLRR
jgi:ribose transport system substrate-binding protein